MGTVMQNRSVEGLIAYCDWLIDKGYATTAQVDPWRTAIRKVFETVEGEQYASLDLTGIDLAEYLARFQTLAGSQYKSESIVTYGRRLRNAIEAHEHYLKSGHPPTFRRGGSSAKPSSDAKPKATKAPATQTPAVPTPLSGPGFVEFPFPLKNGHMAQLKLPSRLDPSDVNRLCTFLRTLQTDGEQAQIPARTGEEADQALAA